MESYCLTGPEVQVGDKETGLKMDLVMIIQQCECV